MVNPSPKFKFVVGIGVDEYGPDPHGFVSSDACEEIMGEFFAHLGFTYVTPFVSMSVRPVLPEPVGKFGGSPINFDLADAYGHPFVLKDDVIAKVEIICAGDFLNVMYSAVVHHLRGGNVREYKDKIKLVTGMSVE
jgi:hypothetical protein